MIKFKYYSTAGSFTTAVSNDLIANDDIVFIGSSKTIHTHGVDFLAANGWDFSTLQSKVAKLGSTTKPVYTSAAGTFAECSTYAGGTAVTLNGTSKAASTASFYAPIEGGTSGQILKSNGSGAPSWVNWVDNNSASLQVSDTTNKKINTSETTGKYIKFTGGTNKFTISDGTNSFDVAVTPSISNNVTGSGLTKNAVVLGNGSSAVTTSSKTIATTLGSDDTTIPTSKAVSDAISTSVAGITDAMVFKGTIGKASGGSGTISALPTSSVKVGHTYKIVDENKSIAAANSATGAAVTAKVGDTIVATDTTPKWVVIPSGDEPSGTVTSVKIQATGPIAIDSDAAITTSGTRTISHSASGATAGTYGPSANVSGANGNTISVPLITVDATGHVTSIANKTYTSVDHTYTVGSKVLKVASNSGTATQAIGVNESSADRTLTISGDGTYITGAVSGNSNAATVTLSHANPTADANSELTAAISGTAGAYALNTEYTVLTGVKAQRDAKGHITGLTYTAQKIKDTNNTYTGYNIAFQNSSGTTVDTYKALTSPNKTLKAGSNVNMTAASNVITISATDTTYTFDGTYNASSNKAATVSTVTSALSWEEYE